MPLEPPVAKRVPHVLHRPTGDVDDPWYWLRDRDDPDTIAYLKAENEYAEEWLAPLADLRAALFDEIKTRTQETDLSVPSRMRGWWYYSRTVEGLSYPIHCRRRADTDTPPVIEAGSPGADEQVLLDENHESEGGDYFSLGAFDVSPDQGCLAWSADRDGSELFRMRMRDLATGQDLPDVLEDTYYDTAWSRDGRYLFYVRTDEAMRPHQIWRHEMGADPSADVVVFQEDDERFHLAIDLTRSEAWIVIRSGHHSASEVHVIPADAPLTPPRLVEPRADDHKYAVDHWRDHFVILTNLDAEDFRVVTAPIDDPGRDQWLDLVPHETGRRIVSIDAFAGHLVLHEWDAGLEQIRVLFADGAQHTLEFTEDVYSVEPGSNPEYGSTTLRFGFESYTTPPTVFDQDLATGERVLRKQTQVLGGFDATHYATVREWATAPDGTRVPVDVTRRHDVAQNGTPAGVLYGYGSYEISIAPWFSVARLSLLDRGMVFAVAHPRGGGEMGRRWYLDGKFEHKPNTFGDTLACADLLVEQGHVAPNRLGLRGGSAGGLLVGACINARPDRFTTAVAEVPFVDVVTTMSDASLPLTVIEWEEWGDPRLPRFADVMLSYSPYDNVRATDYPSLLVTAGLNDPRVAFHEPAKWVAKLRATAAGDEPILLCTKLGAGHAGPSGRYDAWRDEARTLAFVLHTLGAA